MPSLSHVTKCFSSHWRRGRKARKKGYGQQGAKKALTLKVMGTHMMIRICKCHFPSVRTDASRQPP
ncbi:hypothetical protein KP509_05G028000 [Ceratopteris richardii]|uniref:Uncharacterized protein n=1 Tax=Ceratopteris richardii TaxID=49495 RepID=A0A8T2USP2_CERRI|nr:hypothetical protein KP509_05G028000 [Ceratopteris richardii]